MWSIQTLKHHTVFLFANKIAVPPTRTTRWFRVRQHEYLSLCVFEGEIHEKRLLSNKKKVVVSFVQAAVVSVDNENMVLRATHMRRLVVSPPLVSESQCVACAIVLEWIYFLFLMILMMEWRWRWWLHDDCAMTVNDVNDGCESPWSKTDDGFHGFFTPLHREYFGIRFQTK